MSLGNSSIFYGCLKGQLKQDSEIVESVELGCFRLPLPKEENVISSKELDKNAISHHLMKENDPEINQLPGLVS